MRRLLPGQLTPIPHCFVSSDHLRSAPITSDGQKFWQKSSPERENASQPIRRPGLHPPLAVLRWFGPPEVTPRSVSERQRLPLDHFVWAREPQRYFGSAGGTVGGGGGSAVGVRDRGD